MPTVPRYNAQVGLGISQGRQNIQASPAAFGAAEARALGSVSQGINQIAQRMEEIQLENDEAEAREAYINLSDGLRNLSRGENGFLTLQAGQASEEALSSYYEEIEALRAEAAGRLRGDALEMFEELAFSRLESARNQGAAHALSQQRVARDMQHAAMLQDRRNNALEAMTPAEARAELGAGEQAIRERMAGQDADVINSAVDEWRSETIELAISAALDSGDRDRAEAILGSMGNLMVGGADTRMAEAIREDGQVEEHQAAAADIFAQFGSDLAAARRYIRENYAGRDEDFILARYNRLVTEGEEARQEAEDQVLQEALDVLSGGGTIDDLTTSQRRALPTSTQLALAEGRPLVTDNRRYLEFLNQVSGPDGLKYAAAIDLAEVATWADASRFNEIRNAVLEARAQERALRQGQEPPDPSEFETVRQRASHLRPLLAGVRGLNLSDDGDAREIAEMMVELERRVETAQRDGETLSETRINEMAVELATEVNLSRVERSSNWSVFLPGGGPVPLPFGGGAREDRTPITGGSSPQEITQSFSFIEDPAHRTAAANALRRIGIQRQGTAFPEDGAVFGLDVDVIDATYRTAIARLQSRKVPVTQERLTYEMVSIYNDALGSRLEGEGNN